MKYVLGDHARKRTAERKISQNILLEALRRPTKKGYDSQGRIMIKKLYEKDGKARLLLVIGEVIGNNFKIITIIDTSKVKKYL